MHDETQEQDDFGATRASDFGATSALPNPRPPAARPPYSSLGIREQTSHHARSSRAGAPMAGAPMAPRTPAPPAGPATPPPAAAAPTRYCGTCGAPLDPGRPYCGQCGTPVSTSGVSAPGPGPMPSSPSNSDLYSGSNVSWSSDGWNDGDGDAPTVAELPMDDLYGRYAGPGPIDADDSSRSLRLVVGILCLLGSFATAIAAIVLALATFHP